MLSFLEELFNLNRVIPLQKKGNIEYEVDYQTNLIINRGFKIINTIRSKETTVILYRHLYDDIPEEVETSIFLSLLVITESGIILPEPVLKAFFSSDFSEIKIADIDIKKHLSNKGFGTILLGNLINIARIRDVSKITGWISSVDNDHIERIIHFYKKHGFEIFLKENINNTNKIGDIIWTK